MNDIADRSACSQYPESQAALGTGTALLLGVETPAPARTSREERHAVAKVRLSRLRARRLDTLERTFRIRQPGPGLGARLLMGEDLPRPKRERKPPAPPIVKTAKAAGRRRARVVRRVTRRRARPVPRATPTAKTSSKSSDPPGDSDDGPAGPRQPRQYHCPTYRFRSREELIAATAEAWFCWRSDSDLEAALRPHYPQRRPRL
jgi:hypothetical protein